MKALLVLCLFSFSSIIFAQAKRSPIIKDVKKVEVKSQDTRSIKELEAALKNAKKASANNAPCEESVEMIMKKIEEKKKAQTQAGKGFSLQGNKDTGCSL